MLEAPQIFWLETYKPIVLIFGYIAGATRLVGVSTIGVIKSLGQNANSNVHALDRSSICQCRPLPSLKIC